MIDYNYLHRFAKRWPLLTAAPLVFPNFLIAEYQRVNFERERATVFRPARDASFLKRNRDNRRNRMHATVKRYSRNGIIAIIVSVKVYNRCGKKKRFLFLYRIMFNVL